MSHDQNLTLWLWPCFLTPNLRTTWSSLWSSLFFLRIPTQGLLRCPWTGLEFSLYLVCCFSHHQQCPEIEVEGFLYVQCKVALVINVLTEPALPKLGWIPIVVTAANSINGVQTTRRPIDREKADSSKKFLSLRLKGWLVSSRTKSHKIDSESPNLAKYLPCYQQP